KPIEKPKHLFRGGFSQQSLDEMRLTYDEYILFVDHEFGRVLDSLEESGVLDNTYVIFTADHGELFERSIQGHGKLVLFQPVTNIPLLISAPGQQTRNDVHAYTSAVDVIPTLLNIANRPIPDWLEGKVMPPFSGKELSDERAVFCLEARNNPSHDVPIIEATAMIVKNKYKLVKYFGYEELTSGEALFELFDLENDPEELEDLAPSKPQILNSLREELEERLLKADQPYL
ncbi:MAG: sulfatase-like hydrolase/transferase, partial [Chloroflexota bacterium]